MHTSRDGVEFADTAPLQVLPALAIVHAAAWATSRRQAVFFVTWALQRRLATLAELQREVSHKPNSSTFKQARPIIAAIDEGVHSIHEFDFLAECRKRGLPEPKRQHERTDSKGRKRFTDFEFVLGGRTLVVEIDGRGHLDTEVHIDDQWRANELTLQGAPVLRIPGLALAVDPEPFFLQLERAITLMRRAA